MAEQLVNLMAENPSLLPALLLTTSAATANEQIDGGSEPTMGNYLEPDGGSSILMSMFLDSMAMLEAGNDAGTGGGGKASLMMEEEQQQQGQQNTDFEEVGGWGEWMGWPSGASSALTCRRLFLAGDATRHWRGDEGRRRRRNAPVALHSSPSSSHCIGRQWDTQSGQGEDGGRMSHNSGEIRQKQETIGRGCRFRYWHGSGPADHFGTVWQGNGWVGFG